MPEIPKIVHERLRNGPRAGMPAPHPDADVLTAFAEQTLLPGEREQVLGHLALCQDCRAALLLALPPVESVAPLVADRAAAVSPSSKRSWFSRPAFAVPALRWAALAAGVIVAGTVLLHYSGNSNQSVAFKQSSERKAQVAKAPASTPSGPISADQDKLLADQKTAEIATKSELKLSAKNQPVIKAKDAESRSKKLVEKEMPSSASPAPNATVAGVTGGRLAAQVAAAPSSRETVEVTAAAGSVQTPESALVTNRIVADSVTHMPVSNRNVATLMARNEVAAPISKAKPATAAQQSTPMQLAAKAAPQSGALVKNFDALQQAAQFAGTVTDPSGAAVANAKVTVKNQGTGLSASTTTSQSGAYTVKELPVGTYKLTAEALGFKTVSDANVTLNAGVTAHVDFKMPLGQVAEVVTVTGAAPALQTEDAKLDRNIGSAKWSLSAGMLRRSLDGGATWQTALPDGHLLCYAALRNDVWTAGKSGTVFHSADGGANWTQVRPAMGDRALVNDVTGLEVRGSSEIILTTSNGETWSTPDNGKTWTIK